MKVLHQKSVKARKNLRSFRAILLFMDESPEAEWIPVVQTRKSPKLGWDAMF